jgi:plastocyanin
MAQGDFFMAPNTTRRTLHVSFLSFILALMVLALMTMSVSAQAVGPHKNMTTLPGYKLLHTKIEKVSGKANFVPNQLTCKVGQTLEFSNDTKVSQTLTINNGQPFQKIPAGGYTTVTFGGPGTYPYGLKSNPNATLTVTCP